jgi:hypothetical protein
MKTNNPQISSMDQLALDLKKVFDAYYYTRISESIKRGIARKKLLGLKVNK